LKGVGRLLKNSSLRLILGGAALQRCGNRAVLNAAVILLALLCSAYTFADSGADVYKTKCSACHGKNGAGDTMLGKNLKLRPLSSDDVQKQSDDELFTIISKGKKRMPPFDRKLSRDQIHDLVKHIRSLKK
jgi:cytochrome c5